MSTAKTDSKYTTGSCRRSTTALPSGSQPEVQKDRSGYKASTDTGNNGKTDEQHFTTPRVSRSGFERDQGAA